MKPHAQGKLRLILASLANFDGALQGSFRVSKEGQCHSVARGQPNQFTSGFGALKLVSLANDCIQLVNQVTLPIDQKLGVTHNVDEQDMSNFQLESR